MIPAFGFSVGDFIAIIGLIAKVSKAVKGKFGASHEYQHVLLELHALEKTLRHLQALRPSEGNADHVNAIRGMALTCQIPLQLFLEKIQRYEASLGPFSMHSRACFNSVRQKSQWAVFMSEEVAKLRMAVGAKVLSINLLLAAHTSESLSRIEAETHKSHLSLLASILEQRQSIEMLGKNANKVESSVRDFLRKESEKTEKKSDYMDTATETFNCAPKTTPAVNIAVMSFRALAIQLLQIIQHLPAQVRKALEEVVQTNVQMYTLLKAVHNSILRAPAFQPEDSIRFEDVLGRTKFLPYEYFRHIEVFGAYLQTQFKGLPGEQKVLQQQYIILNSGSNDKPISEEEWGSVVLPGASLFMSVLVDQTELQAKVNQCPRIGCNGSGVAKDRPAFKTCEKCDMEFGSVSFLQNTSDRPLRTQGATRQTSRSNQFRGKGPNLHEQYLNQDKLLEEDLEESGIGERNFGPTEQTNWELKVFKRVHLQDLCPFMQTMHSINKSYLRALYIEFLQEDFPSVPGYLIERFGKALLGREQYFSYRESHKHGLRSQDADNQAKTKKTESFERNLSLIASIDSTVPLLGETCIPNRQDESISEASYALSMVCRRVKFPPPPEAAYQSKPFECPICFHTISTQGAYRWRKHVLKDMHLFFLHCSLL